MSKTIKIKLTNSEFRELQVLLELFNANRPVGMLPITLERLVYGCVVTALDRHFEDVDEQPDHGGDIASA